MKSPEEIQEFLDFEAYQLKLRLECFKLDYELYIGGDGFYEIVQYFEIIHRFETDEEIRLFLGLSPETNDIQLKDIK